MNYHRTLASLLVIATRSGAVSAFVASPTSSQSILSSIASTVTTSSTSLSIQQNPRGRSINVLRRTMSSESTVSQTTTAQNEEPRKEGVASPSQLKEFVISSGSRLLVIDVRHPDATIEPGDVKSLAVAGFPTDTYRPQAINLPWSRESKSMELPNTNNKDITLDTPIITHCGGGGRGQKAKEYLEKNGFTNVLNGGGPKETECWAEFGSL